jgi:endonuclease G
MAKRKNRKNRKKAKNRMFTAGLSGVAVCCIALLLLHDCVLHRAGDEKHMATAGTSGEKPEIPQLQNGRTEQIIYHEGYTVSYNPEYKIANWVAYELTAEEAGGQVKRSGNFIPDPMVAENETSTSEDYTRSGYDRGHLAPAGDMKWSHKAMQESFYYTNICPQDKGLNTGIWNSLEVRCRTWASRYGSLLIVTGPVMEDSLKRLGGRRVGIPNTFYKVVCVPTGSKPKGIGFLFENRKYTQTDIRTMAVPIDSVEKVSGIDFFPGFPVEVQKEMEASVEWEY